MRINIVRLRERLCYYIGNSQSARNKLSKWTLLILRDLPLRSDRDRQ